MHEIVNKYGNRWRFSFNAAKSAVLVFGEDRKTHDRNSKHRVFRLGSEKVKEKESYDHVGVKMNIFASSSERVEEKISKGRKTLNASTGLGIRKNGLNMGTCSTIFWQVVVPTTTFGSEVWVCSDNDNEMLLSFQRYAGRRVQRFPFRAPNSSSFYGLGWLKLTSYINVKKLLFILTILKMDQVCALRRILTYRMQMYIKDKERCRENVHRSPVFDIFNIAIMYGLFEVIKDMTLNGSKILSKKGSSKLVWERSWLLENTNWRAANIVLKDNDLLISTMGDTRYLTWWSLSDMDHSLMKMCEVMGKIVCHTSRLKRDDVRLKGLPLSNRVCEFCDMFCVEDIIHILNQCPYYHEERKEMYEKIYNECPNVRRIFRVEVKHIPYYLLGRVIPELDINEMIRFWITSCDYINRMYRKAISNRVGVG